MTEFQAQILHNYPTYKEFLEELAPKQLLSVYWNVSSITQCLEKRYITIIDIREAYSSEKPKAGVDYLERWLIYLNNFSNINKKLEETNAVAHMIYSGYYFFTLADLKVLFEKIMRSEYGTFYGSVDAQRIISSFEEYNKERKKEASKIQKINNLIDNWIDEDVRSYSVLVEKDEDRNEKIQLFRRKIYQEKFAEYKEKAIKSIK